MQTSKQLNSLFLAFFSLAAFAQSQTQNAAAGANGAPAPATPPPAGSHYQLWMTIAIAVSAVILVVCVALIVYLICARFKEHFRKVRSLSSDFGDLNVRINDLRKTVEKINKQTQNGSGSNGSDTSKMVESITRDLDGIDKKMDSLSGKIESMTPAAIGSTLEKCSGSMNDFEAKLAEFLKFEPEIRTMNERLNQMVKETPGVVNLSVKNAVELVNQCQTEGLSTAELIRETNAIAKKYRELRFASLDELAESKKYYDSRMSHDDGRKESEKKIRQLEADGAELSRELDSLKQTMSSLCPEVVGVDTLFDLLKDTAPELRSETVALVVQLYWFAQLSRNSPNKIKAAFTRFDETLFELFSEKQELLQSVRQSIRKFVNSEVFKDTSYEISWPALNSSASEHEDCYNRENNEGNRICKVRSAIITNAGNIESVARIYTSL